MAARSQRTASTRAQDLLRRLSGPEALVLVPAITLAAFFVGGVWLLALTALALPLCLGALKVAALERLPSPRRTDPVTGLPARDDAVATLDAHFSQGESRIRRMSAFAIGIDEMPELEHRIGRTGVERVVTEVAARLRWAVRDSDLVVRLGPGEFGIALVTQGAAEIELLLRVGSRLQAAVSRPITLDGSRLYVSVSLGFCPANRSPKADGDALLRAAEQALARARSKGSATIRAFSPEIAAQSERAQSLTERVRGALETGEIQPWFQPQISLSTGDVTGVEALARWTHPELGLLPPGEFLPVVEGAGLGERLTNHMLTQSLAAIAAWERRGLHIPSVSINFTTEDLRNPHLAEHLKRELDAADLTPDRLTVEVLESVVASTRNDTIIRNLWAVAELGCGIDLDDFGTGHAAIGSIRRFSVGRVKIDRSFVSRLDTDRDQRNVVAAIILMAERLNLDTLAEGVESAAEQAVLARLGCGHVQGYGIARPMSRDALQAWLTARADRPTAERAAPALDPPLVAAADRPAMGKTA